MAKNNIEALRDIADATQSQSTLPPDEVFTILGISNDLTFEENVEILFDVATNPKIASLPRERKLAIIKTCEEIVGNLFLSYAKDEGPIQ